MGMYLSMQRVRFSSPDAYDKFRTVFTDVRHHLMTKPGFVHLTWWEHPDEPGWYNEISMWASKEAVERLAHGHVPQARQGVGGQRRHHGGHHHQLRARRRPGCCASARRAARSRTSAYDLAAEQKTLGEPCPKCGFNFPVAKETANSTSVFKDII